MEAMSKRILQAFYGSCAEEVGRALLALELESPAEARSSLLKAGAALEYVRMLLQPAAPGASVPAAEWELWTAAASRKCTLHTEVRGMTSAVVPLSQDMLRRILWTALSLVHRLTVPDGAITAVLIYAADKATVVLSGTAGDADPGSADGEILLPRQAVSAAVRANHGAFALEKSPDGIILCTLTLPLTAAVEDSSAHTAIEGGLDPEILF